MYCMLLEEAGRRVPEVSAVFYLWTAFEDIILDTWCNYLMKNVKPTHLSLHYDGVRIALPDNMSVEDACKQSEDHIANELGICVTIRQKHHYYFTELLELHDCDNLEKPNHPVLGRDGNCIPLAISILFPEHTQAMIDLVGDGSYAGRSYRECMNPASLHGVPFSVPDLFRGVANIAEGRYLLHVETSGIPHCMAMAVDKSGNVRIMDEGRCWRMDLSKFTESMYQCVDTKAIIVIRLCAKDDMDILDTTCGHLLDSRASGTKRSASETTKRPAGRPMEDEPHRPALPAEELVLCLQSEVDAYISNGCPAVCADAEGAGPRFRCRLCPFRGFAKQARVVDHVEKYHTRHNFAFCNSSRIG